MAIGFGSVDNFQDTIQSTIDNAVDFARSQLSNAESYKYCYDCGECIPEARRKASKGCKYCIVCQVKFDNKISSGYNRRASKDANLR